MADELITFVAGELIKADEVNDNFTYLYDLITGIGNKANTDLSNLSQTGEAKFQSIIDVVAPVGAPIICLDSTLNDGEIWLEGAEVSKTTYATLYAKYGNTYGTPQSSDNFLLPNFKDKVLWGANDFGYLDATLPNITGVIQARDLYGISGCFSTGSQPGQGTVFWNGTDNNPIRQATFNAHNSNTIYQDSATVRPPAIKVRVKTRYQ